MKATTRRGPILAWAAAWTGLAMAAPPANPPILSVAGTNTTTITADRLTYDYRQSWAAFEGNVVVDDGRMRMESEKLTVFLDADGNIRSALATGAVRIRQGERRATCRKAIYQAASQEILLTGDPELTQPGAVVRGETISFRLDTEVLTSTPGYLQFQSGPKKGTERQVR